MEKTGREGPDLRVYTIRTNPEVAAQEQRSRVGISVEAQVKWQSGEIALREWRVALERLGILAFQLRLGSGSSRGFSLWDDLAPVIAVNSHYNAPARIFTIFHEYGHLLLRTDSICEPQTVRKGTSPPPIERWCERFAAAFLLPREHLVSYLHDRLDWEGGRTIERVEDVPKVSRRYKVSLRAAAIRLYEIGAATEGLYEEVSREAPIQDRKKQRGGARGLKRHERRVQELGTRFPRLLLEGLDRKILRLHDVVDYMDVATSQIPELERLVASRGEPE